VNNVSVFLRIVLILGVPTVLAVGVYMFLNKNLLQAAQSANQEQILVEIGPGNSFRDVCRLLEERGVLRRWWSLEVMSKLKKRDAVIKAGEYRLSASLTPAEVLDNLMGGEIYMRSVVVDRGMSIWDLGERVEEAGLLSSGEFNMALASADLLARAGIAASSFEGYLFPGTYEYSRPVTPRQVIWRMLEQGERQWSPDFTEAAFDRGLSRHEILTIASILEQETDIESYWPILSSVIHNRLEQGMRLQVDSTVVYGLPNLDGAKVSDEDRRTESPYNTHMIFGLPPGPIGNPGLDSINAAIYPQETSYLFFAKDGKGGLIFSTTQSEQQEALQRHAGN